MKDIRSNSAGKVSRARLATMGIALVAGVAGGYWGQPWIHENERAVNVIVTAFSILAGFLIAIMTIIGDPTIFFWRSWRGYELSLATISNRLWRQLWLFVLYLGTLLVILIESLVSRFYVTVWLERLYLGMAIAAFIVSFRLPFTLLEIQMERHEEAIRARRRKNDGEGES